MQSTTIFSFKIEAFGQEFEFISDYVVAFANTIKNHSSLDIYREFLTFLKGLWNGHFKTTVLKQWRQMNPLCQSEFAEDELYDKSLLQIMDDFWGTLTPESEKAFLHPLKAYPKLVRGRKHQWIKAEDLAAPSLEAIEKYHILELKSKLESTGQRRRTLLQYIAADYFSNRFVQPYLRH